MGIKVKLVKSHSGASERQVATIVGLGLKKFGSEQLLKDTPAIRGHDQQGSPPGRAERS